MTTTVLNPTNYMSYESYSSEYESQVNNVEDVIRRLIEVW